MSMTVMRISRQGVDETHRGCPRRAPGASRGTARENRGPWRAWEAGCPVRARAGDHRAGAPGRCAKASKKDKGRMPARGLLGHGLEPGQRTPAPGGGGRAPAGPWEAGARGQGPQVLLTGALKILQRVWAAGGGVVAVSTSRSPCRCCWTCWRGPVSSTASPATAQPSGPGRVAMSAATVDRYLAPAGARAVRGRSTTKAGPLLRSSIKIRRAGGRGGGRARVLRGRHRRPLRSGAQGGVRPDR